MCESMLLKKTTISKKSCQACFAESKIGVALPILKTLYDRIILLHKHFFLILATQAYTVTLNPRPGRVDIA